MARLSNYTREKMAVALVRHRFSDRAAALMAESVELFRQVYDDHYDADIRKHMAAIEKKQKDAFSKTGELTVNVEGRRFDIGAEGFGIRGQPSGAWWLPEVAYRPILNNDRAYHKAVGISGDHPLHDRLLIFADARDALVAELDPAYREALGALNQFSTAKRLTEDWPEAMPVIGDLIPEDDRALPTVQVANLNSKFDLPPADRKAA